MIKAEPAIKAMNKRDAQALTERIRKAVDGLWELLVEAHDRQAWKAMGYKTWDAYIAGEFSMSRRRSYQLLDQGLVNRAISSAIGDVRTDVHISEAAARDIKPIIGDVTADIQQRVQQGEEPKKAADEAVKAAREKAKSEKVAQQAEFDRQREEARAALPAAIKERQAAKEEAIAARKSAPEEGLSPEERIAELEEANRILEDENAALKAENKKFSEMKALFDKGGFEAVIAAKDAVINAQAARIERESKEKVRNLNSSEMWRKRAEEAGWSNDVVIPLPGRAAHG